MVHKEGPNCIGFIIYIKLRCSHDLANINLTKIPLHCFYWSNISEPVGEFRQIQLFLQNCVSTLSLSERRAILLLDTLTGSKKYTVGASWHFTWPNNTITEQKGKNGYLLRKMGFCYEMTFWNKNYKMQDINEKTG